MNYADLFRVTLPETMLEVAALLVLIVDLGFLRKAALKLRVTVAALLGVAGCGAALWALHVSTGFGFRFDGAYVLMQYGYVGVAQSGILVLTAITLLLLIDSDFTRHVGEFVAVVLMAASGGLIIAAAQDLLVIFVGLELLSLGLYIMTAFAKTSGKSAEAALKYYLFGGMSAAFLLFGFSYLYGLTGSTNLSNILGAIVYQGASPLLYVAWILVIAGLGFKIAIVPFHLWAPDTYEGAPAPAAAFIASVSKVASFALLISICEGLIFIPIDRSVPFSDSERLFQLFLGTWHNLVGILLVLAAVSMVVGNLAALAQTSVRRLLAYSAIAHAGYMLLGVGTSPVPPLPGTEMLTVGIDNIIQGMINRQAPVLYYVLTYGLTTIGAFGVVWRRRTGNGQRPARFFPWLAQAQSAAGGGAAGAVSLAGRDSAAGRFLGQVQFVCRRAWRFRRAGSVCAGGAGGGYERGFSLLLFASPQAGLRDARHRRDAHQGASGHHGRAGGDCGCNVVVLGCFPALLQGWIESFYPAL
jgi:NADH-quinone oxidoreductase subunit N